MMLPIVGALLLAWQVKRPRAALNRLAKLPPKLARKAVKSACGCKHSRKERRRGH